MRRITASNVWVVAMENGNGNSNRDPTFVLSGYYMRITWLRFWCSIIRRHRSGEYDKKTAVIKSWNS